jgi:hypothetical protein
VGRTGRERGGAQQVVVVQVPLLRFDEPALALARIVRHPEYQAADEGRAQRDLQPAGDRRTGEQCGGQREHRDQDGAPPRQRRRRRGHGHDVQVGRCARCAAGEGKESDDGNEVGQHVRAQLGLRDRLCAAQPPGGGDVDEREQSDDRGHRRQRGERSARVREHCNERHRRDERGARHEDGLQVRFHYVVSPFGTLRPIYSVVRAAAIRPTTYSANGFPMRSA